MRLEHWPLPPEFTTISQRFGEHPEWYAPHGLAGHEGWDLPCPENTPTFATHAGRIDPSWRGEYGNSVWIYGEGFATFHAHLVRTIGAYGQRVQAGQEIGRTGATGVKDDGTPSCTGPHLHWGIQEDGVSNPPFKGWLNPKDYLGRMVMSKLSWQVQRCDLLRPGQPGEWVVHQIIESGVWAIVLIDPDVLGTYNPFPDVCAMGGLRFPGNADLALIQQGAVGARRYVEMCAPRWAASPWVKKWHGPCEPYTGNPENPNDLDPMRWLTEFYIELLDLCSQRGIDMAVGVFGTSQPAGPRADPLPPIFRKWEIFGPVCDIASTIVLHEYGMDTLNDTPENRWHIHHWKRGVEALEASGHRMPPIWIGEHGIDRGGGKTTDGWRVKLGGDEVEYMHQLAVRDAEYSAEPIIQIVTPFVTLPWDWVSFDMIRSMSDRVLGHIMTQGAYRPGGVPVPPIEPTPEPTPEPSPSNLLTAMELGWARNARDIFPISIKDACQRDEGREGWVFVDETHAFIGFLIYVLWHPRSDEYLAVKRESQTWQILDEQIL